MTQEWWHPNRFALKIPHLKARAQMMSRIRNFFDARGYVEVETPALQTSPCMEPHIQAFKTKGHYLHTSPEFAMKKLLVAGLDKIYQIAHVFRDEAPSSLHTPEFTMLEWYEKGLSYDAMMDETISLVRAAADGAKLSYRGIACEPQEEWEIITVVAAVKAHADIDIKGKFGDLAHLQTEAKRIGVYLSPADDWENALLKIIMEKVEPNLGIKAPTILCDYPVSMAALSQPKPGNPSLAERFEVYVCGIELANAFGELTDAKTQRERFLHDVTLRKKTYGDDYPVDEEFLRAIDFGLPACSGNALGIDRLAMMISDVARIDDIQACPIFYEKDQA